MLKKSLSAVLLACILCLLSGTDCRGLNQEKSLPEQARGLIGGAADACLRACGGLPEQARGLIEEWKGLLSGTGCQGMNQEKGLLEQAQELIEERKYPQAIGLLSGIADDEAAARLLEQLYYVISGDYIENLDVGVAAIDREGHVRIAAHSVYFKNLHRDQEATLEMAGKWENIRRLHGGCGLDALDKDGGFHTVRGDQGYDDFTERNRQIAELEPLKLLFSRIYDFAVLRMDGTVYAYDKYSGYTGKDYVKQQMAQWTDVRDMVSGPDIVMVLLGDGTVDFVSAGFFGRQHLDTLEWTDIVAIDGLGVTGCIAGLTSEGTVVVSNHGVDENGAVYTDAFEWSDIIAISKGFESLLGLKRDGTVVAAGNLRPGQEDIAEWTDIVAISAGQDIHVGLKSDGTIVMAGDFGGRLELPDLTGMKDLYVPEVSLDKIDEPVPAMP